MNMKVGMRTESRSSSRDLNFTATLAFGPRAAIFSASAPIFTPDLSVATAVTKLRRPRHSNISGSRTVAPYARPSAVSPWPRSKPINSSCFFLGFFFFAGRFFTAFLVTFFVMSAPIWFRAAICCHRCAASQARPFQFSCPRQSPVVHRNNPPSFWNIQRR